MRCLPENSNNFFIKKLTQDVHEDEGLKNPKDPHKTDCAPDCCGPDGFCVPDDCGPAGCEPNDCRPSGCFPIENDHIESNAKSKP